MVPQPLQVLHLLLLLLLLHSFVIALCTSIDDTTCSPFKCGNLPNVSFPFGISDSPCGASPSFHLSGCNTSAATWLGFADCAENPSFCNGYGGQQANELDPPFVTSIYDQPFGHSTIQGSLDQLGSSNRPYGFVNLTWLQDQERNRSFCDPFRAENVSKIVPTAIDLNDFANSTFRFSSYSVFLLLNCSNWTADSKSALNLGANENSSLCQAYRSFCGNQTKDMVSKEWTSCVQISPWKDLRLQETMARLSCTHFSFFVNISNSTFGAASQEPLIPPSFTRAVLQFTFSHSNLSSEADCQACEKSGGWCGFNHNETSSLSFFNCFCSSDNQTSGIHTCSTVSSATAQPNNASKPSPKTIIIVSFSIFFMASLGFAGLALLWCLCRKQKWSPIVVTASSSPTKKKLWISQRALSLAARHHPISKFCKEFSLQELMQATDFFADETMIADGGFGAVYMGFLKDGRRVAIKRFYHDNYKRLEHFYNEIRILSNLDHPNLVKLYGFCCQDERDLLLVYEYATNGSVADQLHSKEKPAMPWRLRLNIAWEIADALSYLHNSVSPPIYHRDVKTANILLDDEFHVKLADFGLSRYVPLDVTHVSTMPQGTPGYVDPDYHQCYQLTEKSDVYSFGVVLVELISAKPAVDVTRAKGEVNLSTWAVTKITCEAWEELIDPRLTRDSCMENTVKAMGELAFLCLQQERDDRPTMQHAAEVLGQLCKWYDKMWHLQSDMESVKSKVDREQQSDAQDAFKNEFSEQLKDCYDNDSCSFSTTFSASTIMLTNNDSPVDSVSCTQKLLQPNSLVSSPSSKSFSSYASNA